MLPAAARLVNRYSPSDVILPFVRETHKRHPKQMRHDSTKARVYRASTLPSCSHCSVRDSRRAALILPDKARWLLGGGWRERLAAAAPRTVRELRERYSVCPIKEYECDAALCATHTLPYAVASSNWRGLSASVTSFEKEHLPACDVYSDAPANLPRRSAAARPGGARARAPRTAHRGPGR